MTKKNGQIRMELSVLQINPFMGELRGALNGINLRWESFGNSDRSLVRGHARVGVHSVLTLVNGEGIGKAAAHFFCSINDNVVLPVRVYWHNSHCSSSIVVGRIS